MEQLQGIVERLAGFLNPLVDIIWGPFVLIPLLLVVGIFLTVRISALQIRMLPHALWLAFFRRKESEDAEGDISHYQSVSTALAATIGVGNLAGVAGAIGIGGPGALFWMWVTGLLGMATKYSEALLSVKYRQRDAKGEQSGGPMYYLRNGIGGGFGLVLGGAFAIFGAIAAFGIGNLVQANEVAGAVTSAANTLNPGTEVPTWITGLILVAAAGIVIIGGIKSIGRVTALLVPVMAITYILAAIMVLIVFVNDLGAAFQLIFTEAFTGQAAAGGFLGSALMFVIQQGMARGMFSNEAGLGTGGISAAAAKTNHPTRQGLVQMTQTFIDTIIVVSMTGLVLIVTDAYAVFELQPGGADEELSRATVTGWAFSQGIGTAGTFVVALSVLLFAYSTILGWSYYGERCMEYLFGRTLVMPYRVLFVALIFVGATTAPETLWAFSDIFNGLMALPNLLGLLLLSPIIVSETRRYFADPNWKYPDMKITDVRD